MSDIPVLTLDDVKNAVAGTAAAFRRVVRLQPAGGPGTKVFPPTFAGAVYAIENRRLPGRQEPVRCVLLDSVQSQANRMEMALQEAIDAGKLTLPLIEVDFTDYFDPNLTPEQADKQGKLIEQVGRITSLQVPHRLADAILRDSKLDGKPFRNSEIGKLLNSMSLTNATPVFELCPTALLFGMWDSTGPKGGLGPKFERAIVSEVVGIGVEWNGEYRNLGVRCDPLGIRKAVKVLKQKDGWKVADASLPDRSQGKAVEPSKINHGSVPFESQNSGVTIEYAEQITTISLIVLRRLRFPVNNELNTERDVAARTLLTVLGLVAATLAFENGLALRSRNLLWPESLAIWELLDRPGSEPAKFTLTSEGALELFKKAVELAKQQELPWREKPLVLKPSEELIKLVRLSQLEATKEEEEEQQQQKNRK